MDATQGVAFLQALGVKKIRVKDNGWIEGSCPLARWTHTKHVDTSPSFGLSIVPGGRSYFSCFACRSGGAEELLQVLEMYTAGSPQSELYDFKLGHQLLASEVYVLPLPDYAEHAPPSNTVFVEWPSYWLASFVGVDSVSAAHTYLTFRGVSTTTIKTQQLKYDSKRSMIVAPYWDVFGRFAGARGRSINPEAEGSKKHYDYSWQGQNNARLCWYNEGVLNMPGPVVIVEGQFDCWRTEQAHLKTVANLTAKPTWEKMKKLGDCPFVIQIPDRDATGELSIGVYRKFCAQLGIGYKVLHLDEGVKDPAEAHCEYLRDKINELL